MTRVLYTERNCRNQGIGLPERPCGYCHEGICNAECGTCGEIEDAEGECPRSKRVCGHHCNCVWIHDGCDWCGVRFCDLCEELHQPGAHTAVDLFG